MLRWTVIGITATLSLLAQSIPDFTPPTPLFRAVQGNDANEVNRLLNAGANPNEGQFRGSSALMVALMQHNSEAAKALIDKGADVRATDAFGSTTLMWAAMDDTQDITVVSEL